ncbi:MAG: carbon-nitrogen hydrolase family protein [Conexivisphaerales archaeon]
MTSESYPKFKVAAVQAASTYVNRNETIETLSKMSREASSKGARLVVFGESFIPCFPVWNLLLRPVDQHRFYRLLYDNAVELGSEAFNKITEVAAANNIYLSVGITEKNSNSIGTLWNTNLLISPSGRLLNVRRKLVPTWAEKLTWANGDGSGLSVAKTELGNLGVLICGENTNTLARFSLLAQGENVHIATFPTSWPFERPGNKDYNLTDAIRIRAAAHSFEGKIFTVVASCSLNEESIRFISRGDKEAEEILSRAAPPVSAIFGPTGEFVTEPLVGNDGIVVAEIDLAECIKWKEIHDITGGYNRFDIFRLQVNKKRLLPLTVEDYPAQQNEQVASEETSQDSGN